MGYRPYVEQRLQAFAHQEQVAKKEREDVYKRQGTLSALPSP